MKLTKKRLMFQEETFRAQENPKKKQLKNLLYFGKWNILAPKNLIKLFYYLIKLP